VSTTDHDTDWLPPTSGGRPRRSRLRRSTVVVAVLLLVPLVYAGALAVHADTSISRIEVDGLQAHTGGPLNTLVVGSDSRAELTPEERRELSTGGEVGERTDTILLLSVQDGRAAMLSFPRDLWVERCDGSEQRINTAVQLGGVGCLADTIQQLSGIPVHHAISVSFVGFRDVVDAVGGVELCLPRAIQDDDAGIDLPSGCQTLDGRQALGYVRVRKIDNDLKRIERQQGFLKALAGEVASPSTLLNPVRTWRTVGEVGQAITADEELGLLDLTRLAWGGRGIASGQVVTATVPTRSGNVGAAAVEFATDEAPVLFASFRDGTVLDGAAGGEPIDRSEVELDVLNGAGIAGAAGQTADALRGVGYQVADVGNAADTSVTTIVHPAGDDAAAAQLAADVEAAVGLRPELEPREDVDRIVLILGRDLAG
jgi:LCP family protein required for cell wall assembly